MLDRSLPPVASPGPRRAPARAALALAFPILIIAPSAAWAIDQAALTACRATADLVPRLACYDGLGRTPVSAPPAAPAGIAAYPRVDLVDLKVDRDKLLGRGVSTAGRLEIVGSIVFLRTQEVDNTPLPVSIVRLSAERQREVKARCSSSCTETIKGKVVHVTFGIGLAAEDIVVGSSVP